jgi:hypothetical protein
MNSTSDRKVIFLDIDGVLNFHKPESSDQTKTIEREPLSRLKRVLDATEAKVVLASTWRHEDGAVDEARAKGVPIDDILPDLRPKSRGDEVQAWLTDHPHVDRFLVLDDEDDDYASLPFFQPQAGQALDDSLADEMICYLKGYSEHCDSRNWLVKAFQVFWLSVTGHRG